jgi:hypothetical protein
MVALDEQLAVAQNPMHEVRWRAVQYDDVSGDAEVALEVAREIEQRVVERARRVLEPHRNVDVALLGCVAARAASEEVRGDQPTNLAEPGDELLAIHARIIASAIYGARRLSMRGNGIVSRT